jgi:hypothetical protein
MHENSHLIKHLAHELGTLFVLYVLTTAPAWILMRTSDSIFAKTAQWVYSPMYFMHQHSDFVHKFFQRQWDFWFPILGITEGN